MKKAIGILFMFIWSASFAQVTPSKIIRVTGSTAVFSETVAAGSNIVDNGSGKQYLVLLPLASTKTIGTCTLGTDIKRLDSPTPGTSGNLMTSDGTNWTSTAFGTPWTGMGYVTGTPWTSMGYVTGTPWTSMGYVTGTPWTGMGYLISGGALGTPSSGTLTNCTFPTLNQSTTGTAAKLTTARTIAGSSFDGSANISLANKFIVQGTADAGLSGPQFLGALGNGIVKNATSTGVLSIATGPDLPVMSATAGGAVPTPPNDPTKYLRGDGTFQTLGVTGPTNHQEYTLSSATLTGYTLSGTPPMTPNVSLSMDINYTPTGNHALVMFSAYIANSASGQYGDFYMYDSTIGEYFKTMHWYCASNGTNVSFQALRSVTTNVSHSFTVLWRSTSLSTTCSNITFNVIDLP